jgi:hypothetical protein
MAKRSRRSTPRTRKTPRVKSKRTRKAVAEIEAAVDAESNVDGCEVDFTLGAITEDAELPPAKGGVEVLRTPPRRRAARR